MSPGFMDTSFQTLAHKRGKVVVCVHDESQVNGIVGLVIGVIRFAQNSHDCHFPKPAAVYEGQHLGLNIDREQSSPTYPPCDWESEREMPAPMSATTESSSQTNSF